MQYALTEDWLSASDICEEFPPEALMTALEPARELRSRLLVEAAGVHTKIAPKKSVAAAAEDLSLALNEGVCTAETIIKLVPVDELVRYLDRGSLWQLLTRDQFWLEDGARPQARMLHMIETGLSQDLLDLHRLLRAVTPEQICSDVPRELLEKALATAIHAGLDDSAFEPSVVLESISLDTWLEHLPLGHFWETVIQGEVAPSAGLSTGSAKMPPARPQAPTKREPKATLQATPAPPAPASSDAETVARERAINNLRAIDRLPARAESLRSPILLGLDSMYADLLTTETDEDRAERIREAFPNPAMLEEALYAMAEALDSRLTEEALKARGADASSLVQLVLFEERRRANRQAGISPSAPPPPMMPASAPPPPTSDARPAPGAPPLPPQARRVSNPPPPLPAQARRARS